ncbi:unnamed protein product, partial [Adineta steineri]
MGRVLRCHVAQRSNNDDDDFLHEGDFIIFTIHHIAFEIGSLKPFIKAFEQACWGNEKHQSPLLTPQYIDFTLYEQTMLVDPNLDSEMNKARRYWSNIMQGYDWNRIRPLMPIQNRNDQIRSGHGYSTTFFLDQDVVDAMMQFAASNNITMFSLSLACYYVFLFQLINDDDLCVAGVTANRYVPETKDMIG